MHRLQWVLWLTFFYSAHFETEEVLVISHPANPVTALAKEELQRIFLNKLRRWQDGTRIIPVTLETGQIHEQFLETYVHKTRIQFSLFWKRIIFTGKGIPPTTFSTEIEVVAYVSGTPGAIGYVSSQTPLDGAEVLRIQ